MSDLRDTSGPSADQCRQHVSDQGTLPADMGRPSPLVSVVVPVYNAANYLQEALDSLVAQTYNNLEILVMDDASSDESAEIARSYGDEIRFYQRSENLGQFSNAWDGIQRAEGVYVCVFHADDVYHPEIIERETRFLEAHPEVGAVFCLDVSLDEEGWEYARSSLPSDLVPRRPLHLDQLTNPLLMYGNCFLRTPGAMVRAELYREVGPFRDDEFGHAADLDMWLRIARHAPVAVLDEHLFGYRHRADSADRSYRRRRREVDVFFQLVEQHLTETGLNPQPEALESFEARREEDRLLLAADDYVRGDRGRLRRRLKGLRLNKLLRTNRVQRARLLLLYGVLQVLARLPRISFVAEAFRHRWQYMGSLKGSRGAGTTT